MVRPFCVRADRPVLAFIVAEDSFKRRASTLFESGSRRKVTQLSLAGYRCGSGLNGEVVVMSGIIGLLDRGGVGRCACKQRTAEQDRRIARATVLSGEGECSQVLVVH